MSIINVIEIEICRVIDKKEYVIVLFFFYYFIYMGNPPYVIYSLKYMYYCTLFFIY